MQVREKVEKKQENVWSDCKVGKSEMKKKEMTKKP